MGNIEQKCSFMRYSLNHQFLPPIPSSHIFLPHERQGHLTPILWQYASGIGVYASWFLGAVIFRDVQTGSKYQFANDRWLAVEYSDGEVGLGC